MLNFIICAMQAHCGNYAPTVLDGRMRIWDRWLWKKARPYYQIVLVQDGVHLIEVNGSQHRCAPGSIYLIEPGMSLQGRLSPGSKALMIAFSVMACPLERNDDRVRLRIANNVAQPRPEDIWGISLPLFLPQELTATIADTVRQMSTVWWQGPLNHFHANMRLCRVLEQIVDYFTQADEAENQEAPWVVTILPSIEEHLPSLRGVDDMAALVGLSRSHFSRMFRDEIGESPAAYLRRRRLDRCAELLRGSTLSIAAIAHGMGYSSQSAFTNAWNQAYGMSPGQWRRRLS